MEYNRVTVEQLMKKKEAGVQQLLKSNFEFRGWNEEEEWVMFPAQPQTIWILKRWNRRIDCLRVYFINVRPMLYGGRWAAGTIEDMCLCWGYTQQSHIGGYHATQLRSFTEPNVQLSFASPQLDSQLGPLDHDKHHLIDYIQSRALLVFLQFETWGDVERDFPFTPSKTLLIFLFHTPILSLDSWGVGHLLSWHSHRKRCWKCKMVGSGDRTN